MNLSDWFPMSPDKGPPLPQFLQLYWPWYEAPSAPPPPPTQGQYCCPYEANVCYDDLDDLIAHVAEVHPDKPPLSKIEIIWG